ncbi:MAG: MBL fold metallo-hydrolase [Anaerolineae bacterium]|nr:MBL fold metallo-hydrolase [Anaerolineae bacterium]
MHLLANLNVPAGRVVVHWFEQSSYAVKDSRGTIVQVDPYFLRNRPAEKFIHPEPALDEAQLPTDYVLLTHAHSDHTCPESIERIWQAYPQARFIGPAESVNKILAETTVSADHTQVIRAGESAGLGTMTVSAVYAKPPAGDPAANIPPPDVTHLGFVLEADGVRLYFSGDPINTFAGQAELVQAVAALKPDIGFLTNHPTEGEFPFYDGCVKMAQRIGLKHAVPAHRACFVKRDYDPQEWAAQFPAKGPQPLIIPRNSHIIYP